ncbi:MAG: hypothetical protein AABZ15_13095 [Nitrospirota bacterium]
MIIALLLPAAVLAEELEIVNRPVNTSGMTGLLATTSPFTLPPKILEIGVMVLSENSLAPNYTATEYPMTISMGLSHSSEIALKCSFHYVNVDPDQITRGMGDTDLAYKWNIRPQTEFSSIPGVALILAGVFPTGDKTAGMNSVSHWGGRVGISLGSELIWEDHIIGIFADGQIAAQDLSDDQIRDSYTLVNAGVLFPISKYRNLQMIIEYSQRKGKDIMTIDGADFSAVTYGLRLVNERFNLTFGTQFLHKSQEGLADSNRMVGILSIKL